MQPGAGAAGQPAELKLSYQEIFLCSISIIHVNVVT